MAHQSVWELSLAPQQYALARKCLVLYSEYIQGHMAALAQEVVLLPYETRHEDKAQDTSSQTPDPQQQAECEALLKQAYEAACGNITPQYAKTHLADIQELLAVQFCMDDAKSDVTMSVMEYQLVFIKICLELYFRYMMGQTWDLSEELCSLTFIYNKADPDNSAKFDTWLIRRDTCKKLLNAAYTTGIRRPYLITQTFSMRLAQDVWQVIRHALYMENHYPAHQEWVDARTPLLLTDVRPAVAKKTG